MEDIKANKNSGFQYSSCQLHKFKTSHINQDLLQIPEITAPNKQEDVQDCWKQNSAKVDSKEPWTQKEELEMLITHQKHQNKWTVISQALKGRSNNGIKNRFYSIFRKIKNKIKKMDFHYELRLEVVEAAYIISLMEQCFLNPQPVQNQAGKRGKDFIHSLLKGLLEEEVRKYKIELQKHMGKSITLEELWLEMTNQGTNEIIPELNLIPKNNKTLFSYIAELPTYEKATYTLPLPQSLKNPESLTNDEKEFIKFQAFPSKEPCSANTYFACPMLTSSLYSPAPFSAGLQHAKNYFEGFSDFTEANKRQNAGYIAQTIFSHGFPSMPMIIPIPNNYIN